MIRDYTEETKERLLKQIDDVNDDTWCWLTDKIGDLVSSGKKWIGLLDLKDDMSNVESYQREILDKTDMTKKELRQIFEEVYSIDNQFKKKFSELNGKEKTYNEKISKLIGMINPNFQIASSKEIKEAMAPYNDKLKNIDKQIAESYTAEMDWAAKEAAKDAGKNFLKGLGKIAGGIGGILAGNPASAIDVLNGVFQVGSSLQTAINLGGYAVCGNISDLNGGSLSDKLSQKSSMLQDAVKSSDNEGLADVFEDNGWDHLATAMNVVDTAADIVSFASGFDGFITGKGPFMFDKDMGFDLIEKTDDFGDTLSKGWKTVGKAINYITPAYDAIVGGNTDEMLKTITKNAIPIYDQIQSAADTVNDGIDFFVGELEDLIN